MLTTAFSRMHLATVHGQILQLSEALAMLSCWEVAVPHLCEFSWRPRFELLDPNSKKILDYHKSVYVLKKENGQIAVWDAFAGAFSSAYVLISWEANLREKAPLVYFLGRKHLKGKHSLGAIIIEAKTSCKENMMLSLMPSWFCSTCVGFNDFFRNTLFVSLSLWFIHSAGLTFRWFGV